MKKLKRLITFIVFVSLITIVHSCKKEKVPTLTTSSITNITGTAATGGGTITDEGSGTVIARGVCWSTGITPTILDNKSQDGGGVGTFISNSTGLEGATPYYIRAYATNSAGTGYG
jgi:starch-binding outer membrane protein SusE/F